MGASYATPGERRGPAEAPKVVEQRRQFHVVVHPGSRAAQGFDQHIGLKVVVKSSGLVVLKVNEDGVIAEWNAANSDKQVCPGDQIASVNGKSESLTEMLSELHNTNTVDIGFLQNPHNKSAGSGACHGHRRGAEEPDVVQLPLVCPGRVCGEDVTCAICLNELPPEARVLQLPCGHMYHLECAAKWLKRKRACPLCKRTVGRGSGDKEDFDADAVDEGSRPQQVPRGSPARPFGNHGSASQCGPTAAAAPARPLSGESIGQAAVWQQLEREVSSGSESNAPKDPPSELSGEAVAAAQSRLRSL